MRASAATARSTVRFAFEACSIRWRARWGLDPCPCGAPTSEAPTFTDNDLMVNSYGLPECIDWVERRAVGRTQG